MLGINNVGQSVFNTPAGVISGSPGSIFFRNPANDFATSGAAIANRAAIQSELGAPGNFNGLSLFNRRFNGNINTRRGFEAGATYTNLDANIANRAFTGPVIGTTNYLSRRIRDRDIRRMRTLGPFPSVAGYPYGYSYGYPYNVPYQAITSNTGFLNAGYGSYAGSYAGYPYAGSYAGTYAGYPYAGSGSYAGYPYAGYGSYAGYPYAGSLNTGYPTHDVYPNGYPIYGTYSYAALGPTLGPYGGPFYYPPASPECGIHLACAEYSNPNDCRSCVSSRGGSSHCADQICGPHVLI